MHRAATSRPKPASIHLETDPDLIRGYLEDAAHYPGGHADAVVRPATIDEVAEAVRRSSRVMGVGARSSLTGGATPDGGVVVSTERFQDITFAGSRVTAGAGVTLTALQEALATRGAWFPPSPTFMGATIGGAVATNAAGAATFKYGSVRNWVEAITVVLPCADILTINRGEVVASDDGGFELSTSSGEVRISVPRIDMPDVPKRSAGYFAARGMDLIDLFIGAEGTLGVIVSVTLRTAERPVGACWALVPLAGEEAAVQVTSDLRAAAQQTWRSHDPHGVDLAAIEHIDERSLGVLREDGVDRRLHITLPPDCHAVLLAQLELRSAVSSALWEQLGDGRSPTAAQSPLGQFCRLLDRHGAVDQTEIALPGDARRVGAFIELREAVPAGVNRRVALARAADGRIHKTAADMIVPFAKFSEMMRVCRDLFAVRDLDLAVWGHISDGNVHPNVIPRSFSDVERGKDAILELARYVISVGGCPLAEHGVGRNPVKQQLLRMLYGDDGIREMQRVKQALDPEWKLAPGVLFRSP